MRILSTNISEPKTIQWHGKTVTTGIYKTPSNTPIYLGKENVKHDEVSDRKVHGGEFKACYLFSSDHYPYWQERYPHLEWTYGMLGENLTVGSLNEKELYVGDIYKIGNAVVQVTQPREPCYKFGVKFGTQEVLKQFIAHGYPGTYVRVLEEGTVAHGDKFQRIEKAKGSVSIYQFFEILYAKDKNQELLHKLVENEAIPMKKRVKLAAYIKTI